MNSTFSRKLTFCLFTTSFRRNILFSALPRTTIIHGRKFILLTGPSHSHISTNLTISKPLDVCTIGNSCFSIFFGFISAKLLYNTCNEFRTYLSATSQLIKRSLPHRIKHEYHLPVTNVIYHISTVAILKIQNLISNFSNQLRITFANTYIPSTPPIEMNTNNNTHVNSNNYTHINNKDNNIVNNNNVIHPNDNYKQHNTSLFSIISPYLSKLPIHNFRNKHTIPDVIPILLPTHKYIPSPAPYSLNSSATRDTQVPENNLRQAANNGNINAGFNLGMMYTNGTGVGQENQLAHEYFKMGSSRGSNSSKLMSMLLILKTSLNTPNPCVIDK